ncbi:hypothetical protein BaRGS_00018016 [Batillaria attramentaria]|uniref:Uncharacterized protein n=1 Tax=Batillaria attramentaria TaxID=370345 RepID=A0ABD0KUD7_9CAEN
MFWDRYGFLDNSPMAKTFLKANELPVYNLFSLRRFFFFFSMNGGGGEGRGEEVIQGGDQTTNRSRRTDKSILPDQGNTVRVLGTLKGYGSIAEMQSNYKRRPEHAGHQFLILTVSSSLISSTSLVCIVSLEAQGLPFPLPKATSTLR